MYQGELFRLAFLSRSSPFCGPFAVPDHGAPRLVDRPRHETQPHLIPEHGRDVNSRWAI